MKFDVSFALARTPERFKIKCRELAAGKEKLRARGIYPSLRIDKAQTSSAVSTSKDEKKPPFSFSPGFTLCVFINTVLGKVGNQNTELVRGLLGLDRDGLAGSMHDSLLEFSQRIKPRDPLDFFLHWNRYICTT
jgi:hypothetical protein